MPAIDFKAALGNPTSIDHANIEIQGMRVSRTIKMALFTINENAVAQGDYVLAKESYPVARVKFSANRNVFRLQPGDVFKFVYPKYGITEMICRVVFIEEEDVESEKILITAIEESIHATAPISIYTEPDNYRRRKPSGAVGVLDNIVIIEAPYSLAGEVISIGFLVPKKTGNEEGYYVYMSQDGDEYYKLRTTSLYQVSGTVAEDYPETSTIDDEQGILIDFDSNQYTDALQTISRIELMGTRNSSLIGDELVTFQTVTPITASQFKLTGVYRGRWGTVHKAHLAGETFTFIGAAILENHHYSFLVGATRYFKFVPFSSSATGALSAATVYSHTFTGEAFTPYEVINLKANDENYNPLYDSEDIELTWTPRVRGVGTGVGIPSSVVDSSQTHEGKFRVTIEVGGSTVRTVEDLDVYTYNYTAANIIADNGSYVSPITLNVTNYITGEGSVEYESDKTSVVVRRLAYSTTTTTTTTSTTTTTTTVTTTTTT